MSCCAPGAESAAADLTPAEQDDETLLAASRDLGKGLYQIELAVPDVHCGACMQTIEKALGAEEMVETARVNLSSKRVRISYRPKIGRPSALTQTVANSGYRVFVPDPDADPYADKTLPVLIRSLAVSGFAAANIMLFSVSIWSGAEPVTRDLFHWISALIAIPAVAYAGQVFYRSAWAAVTKGHLNMDVPISLAVLLALGLSLFETLNHGQHAYFDASVSLLFFLLIGRTLDHVMRERARGGVRNLTRIAPRRATLVSADGQREQIALNEVQPGMVLEVAPGARVPVDGRILSGTSELDLSLVNGESVPVAAGPDTELLAGTLNLSGLIQLEAQRPAADSFLARMVQLMEAAEGAKSRYRRIADRAADIYAPAVHLLALLTFFGWGLLSGDWYAATTHAIAVLIITCPCALALAVPIAHVVAAGRLFENGILMRDGAALERLAEINRIAFDKTGTLTEGRPVLLGQVYGGEEFAAQAARLSAASHHPYSMALSKSQPGAQALEGAREVPGSGVEAEADGTVWRLGRAAFCGAEAIDLKADQSVVWLSRNGEPAAAFAFADAPRVEAYEVLAGLKRMDLSLSLLSGDRTAPVKAIAERLGIDDARAELSPEGKVAALEAFAGDGEHVLMVGDGLNDAPALHAADVSMVPASGADVSRVSADFVYTGNNLGAVPFALDLARRAGRVVRQNFGLALAYNCVAVPLAVSGQVTPLVAALAMSSSSILVTLNSLRLRLNQTSAVREGTSFGANYEASQRVAAE